MTGRKKYGEGLEQLMIKAYSIICETWSSVIMSCMASSGTELLLFSDDETEDRSV